MATGHLIKREKVYYARYYDKAGERHWKSLRTNSKEIAKKKLADLIDAMEKQEVGWRLNPKPIKEYLVEYLSICEAEHSPRTYRVEKQVLRDFVELVAVKHLHQVTADQIESYKVRRSKEVKESTVNRSLAMIKAFFNRALQFGYIDRSPAQYAKRLKEKQRRIEHLSDEEVKKLLKACSPRVQKIITVFLVTGMRLGELAHLRWKDIDYRHNLIHIQNQGNWTTKNYKPRTLPMHKVAKGIFQSLPKGRPNVYIFETKNGKTIEGYIRGEVLRYAKKAGVRANIKMFRSTFASNLVMSDVDIYTVSKLLGHHDVKITEKHYAHLTPDFLGQSISRLNFEVKKEN